MCESLRHTHTQTQTHTSPAPCLNCCRASRSCGVHLGDRRLAVLRTVGSTLRSSQTATRCRWVQWKRRGTRARVWMRMCGCGRERCVCVCMCYRVHDISLFLTPPFVFGVFSPPPLLLFSPLPPLCPFTSLLRARATDARWCRRSFLFESKRKPRRPSWPGRWRRHPAAARGMQRVSHNARMRVCVCACVRVCVCVRACVTQGKRAVNAFEQSPFRSLLCARVNVCRLEERVQGAQQSLEDTRRQLTDVQRAKQGRVSTDADTECVFVCERVRVSE